MKLTIDYLKQESHNFDLECVFVLDLSKKGIKELDEIKHCVNLEILNLSENDISDLSNLKDLTKLQYINLSNNKIINLKGLEYLENLKTLNLAGNNIQETEEFFKLKNLSHLTNLILNDPRKNSLNPVCFSYKNYKTEIKRIIPTLEFIDGESYKVENKNFLNNEEKISESQKSLSIDETDLKACSQSWFDQVENYTSKKVNIENIVKSLNEEREKFNKNLADITKSIETSTASNIEFTLRSLSAE